MPGGRPPKPHTLRALQGNAGKRKLPPKDAPKATAAPTDPPAMLTGYALEEWKRVAPEAHRLGRLTILGVQLFAGYCVAYMRWRSAKEAVEAEKVVQVAIASGLVKMEREYLVEMRRAASDFGMSPTTDAKAAGAGKPLEEEDPFARWTGGKVIGGGKKG